MIVARIAPAANAAPDPKPPFEIPAKVTAKAAVAKKNWICHHSENPAKAIYISWFNLMSAE